MKRVLTSATFFSLSLIIFIFACGEKPAPVNLYKDASSIRFATYDISRFSTEAAEQGDRIDNLREVIRLLDADVIGLQEIKDRAALHLLFSPDEWQLVIDDDSTFPDNVALAVKRPLVVLDMDSDMDAEDRHFYYTSLLDNVYFPGRRDLLHIPVALPDLSDTLHVIVHHGISRRKSRQRAEVFRCMASELILIKAAYSIKNKKYIILGNFNDSPDDRSLNILEKGDRKAEREMENRLGPYMANLTEPLYKKGYVSTGRDSSHIIDDFVNTIDPNSRKQNFNGLERDESPASCMYDQILVPKYMHERYVKDSAGVFNHAAAVRGSETDKASDHLPVFADFTFYK